MALVTCKDCGNEISTSAKACPKCGAKKSKSYTWIWVVLGTLLILFPLPYLMSSPAKRAATSARADCERVFPMERGGRCDRIYDETFRRESSKSQ